MVRVSSYESTGTFIRRSSSLEVFELLSTLGAERLRGGEERREDVEREKERKEKRKKERGRGGRRGGREKRRKKTVEGR